MYLVEIISIQFCNLPQGESPLQMFGQISAIAVKLGQFVLLQVEKNVALPTLNIHRQILQTDLCYFYYLGSHYYYHQ